MSGRRRSSSFAVPAAAPSVEAVEATQKLWELVCYAMEDPLSQQTLLHSSSNVCLIKTLLDRAHQLDYFTQNLKTKASHWLSTMLQLRDGESGYTPMHRAVLRADLPILMLLLRYTTSLQLTPTQELDTRLNHRPLALLQGEAPNLSDAAKSVFSAMDKEGFTAFQLLERLQVNELANCRKSLVFSSLLDVDGGNARNGRPRQNSFQAMLQPNHEQNEFADLHQYMQQEQQQRQHQSIFNGMETNHTYSCEVLAFGRSNHLALGVQGGSKNHDERTTSTLRKADSNTSATTFRPHRVQTFAQDRVGRQASAVAIAAATHHTLVATRNGHLYAFGVGTGGRLGTGDNEKHSPAPTRVFGPLTNRRVVAIAAAENHSLCVTSDGAVYAFGSNRFGQLGYTSGDNSNESGSSSSRCCLPRRVDDLWKKHVLCISVAAGEKHSVALSQKGEAYVWGCNASGQLGINRRSTSNSALAHKVQRVDALWNDDKRRICFQVAASSQATLVLVKPASGGLPVNQVFAWGHGNHVPAKVQFLDSQQSDSRTEKNVFLAAGSGRRSINPVSIACARHHNAAITSDGRVYTWGFHADPLGGSPSNKTGTSAPKAAKNTCSRPQLVTGMLPEEGGGFAVAVSASENHTAVVTNEGSLYTWGASYGKGVLGHEGVRWQPSPKRVSGVSRAVAVCAAKEHTILLMGASFPTIESSPSPSSTLLSLERLAALEVVKHVDLFNVLPILMTANRTNCRFVVDYCQEFIRLNMDGVLNVGQKSTMDMYLKEQVASGLLLLDEDPRDRRERPLVLEVALAAVHLQTGLHESETILSDPVDWIQSCEKLFRKESLNALLNTMRRDSRAKPAPNDNLKYLRRRSSSSVGSISEAYIKKRSSSVASDAERDVKMSSSERCIMLTTNMDLSTRELVQAKYDSLTREVRGLKKRLAQISKLESMISEDDPDHPACTLTADQEEKIARRPQLESELCIFEPALEKVERRMLQFNLRLKRLGSLGNEEETQAKEKDCPRSLKQTALESKSKSESTAVEEGKEEEPKASNKSLRCTICKVACPDDKSYALHMNGRKHRNREAQEADEERKKAAASMMEQRHRQQMEQMTKSTETRGNQPTTTSAWTKPKIGSKSAVKPKYKLPQPNNSAQELVVAKSFQEIMADEAKRSESQTIAGSRKKTPSASRPLQLPPGSAPAMKSTPWAGNAMVKPVVASASPMSPLLRKAMQPPKNSPVSPRLPPSPTKTAASPLITASPSPGQTSKNMSSFGDFIRKAPATPLNTKSRTSPAPWSASAVPKQVPLSSLTPAGPKTSSPGVTFEDICKQEEDFRNNLQDQSYKDNSSWFIQRRERAGSFTVIQEAATRKREEELMIEEQKRIEEQIQREVAEQKKREAKKRRQQAKKKAKQKKAEDGNDEAPQPKGNNKKTNKKKQIPKGGTKGNSEGPLQEGGDGATPSGPKNNNRDRRNSSNKNRRKSGKAAGDTAGDVPTTSLAPPAASESWSAHPS